MAIPDGGSYVFCDTKDIIRFKAQGRYTEIFLQSGKKLTVSKNLGEYEQMLADLAFLRVHHSHLVNCNHILKFDKSDGGFLQMSDQSLIEVSRRKKDELVAVIKGLG
jgi:two-component system LytT family response regulator